MIRTVSILGAGAVGSYMLWGLSQKNDIELSVIASGERAERFKEQGFCINGEIYNPIIKEPAEARGTDLLLVCLKYNSLPDALESIAQIVDEHTIVMSLMNGVDSEDIIATAVPMDNIVHSLIKVASERIGNNVKFDPETTIGIIYGEMDKKRDNTRVEAITELFSNTGLHYRSTDEIEVEIWTKFRLNVPFNLPQAMLGVGVGAYKDSEHVSFISDRLRDELDAIAQAKGIDINKADQKSLIGSKVKPRARYSTLQDLDAHRHTEIDMFSGALMRMGKELGIPTPYNEMTYHMIKALEEKNDGKFEYDDNY